jgi:ParB family chromosome partitioning protein
VLARSSASMGRALCALSAGMDEPAVPESEPEIDATDPGNIEVAAVDGVESEGSNSVVAQEEPEDDDGLKPIPDRLMIELTAYRTLALRDALAQTRM